MLFRSVKVRERIAKLIAAQTGQSLDKVTNDIDRDYWMTAEEALEYGLISRIIERQSDLR